MTRYALVRRGVSAWKVAKPLIDEAIDRYPHLLPRASVVSTLLAAVASPDPHPMPPGHSASPRADRLLLARAPSRSAGAAGAGLPAHRREFAELAAGSGWASRPPGGTSARQRVCRRRGPRSCTARWRRRACLRGARRHADPHRPARRDRSFFSGKHHKPGMNLQVIASPDGHIPWISGMLPGAVHDLAAAQIWASCGNWRPMN
jgi:hypothetical protein